MIHAAGRVEAGMYGEACRLEELIAFAQRMKWRRLGIAFCIGLSEEAERLAGILEKHFSVVSVCCKVCGMTRGDLGEVKKAKGMSKATCNPLGQALLLNEERTDLNLIVGLCVGHDILFTQHSDAPVTTFIVKDRVTAHNPAGILYSRYGRRRFEDRNQEQKHVDTMPMTASSKE
jgi:uncharacterized metal-binding protein